jgi:hypothetical protein
VEDFLLDVVGPAPVYAEFSCDPQLEKAPGFNHLLSLPSEELVCFQIESARAATPRRMTSSTASQCSRARWRCTGRDGTHSRGVSDCGNTWTGLAVVEVEPCFDLQNNAGKSASPTRWKSNTLEIKDIAVHLERAWWGCTSWTQLALSLKAAGFQPLNLYCEKLVSKLAFRFNLCRYSVGHHHTGIILSEQQRSAGS